MPESGLPGDIDLDELEAGTRADQKVRRAKFKDFQSNIKLTISRIIENIIGLFKEKLEIPINKAYAIKTQIKSLLAIQDQVEVYPDL